MAEKCSQDVWNGFHTWQCPNKAKVERDGKHYCGRHDPVRIAEKRDSRNRKWQEEFHAEDAARKRAQRLQEAKAEVLAAAAAWAIKNPYDTALFNTVERLKEAENG